MSHQSLRRASVAGVLLLAIHCTSQPAVHKLPLPTPAAETTHPLEADHKRNRDASTSSDGWNACDDPSESGIDEIAIERPAALGYYLPRPATSHEPVFLTGPGASYTLVLRKDGTATYSGYESVPIVGRRVGTIPRVKFKRLAQLANEIGFQTLARDYWCSQMDGDILYVSVVTGGLRRTIVHHAPETNGPARLAAFEQLIDGLGAEIEWHE